MRPSLNVSKALVLLGTPMAVHLATICVLGEYQTLTHHFKVSVCTSFDPAAPAQIDSRSRRPSFLRVTFPSPWQSQTTATGSGPRGTLIHENKGNPRPIPSRLLISGLNGAGTQAIHVSDGVVLQHLGAPQCCPALPPHAPHPHPRDAPRPLPPLSLPMASWT